MFTWFLFSGMPDWVHSERRKSRGLRGSIVSKECTKTDPSISSIAIGPSAATSDKGFVQNANCTKEDHDGDIEDELRLQSAFYMAHLNSLLIKTRYDSKMELAAISVPREENLCADALASLDVDAFRKIADEEALPKSDQPKKVKQLLFLPPFRVFPLFSPAF